MWGGYNAARGLISSDITGKPKKNQVDRGCCVKFLPE